MLFDSSLSPDDVSARSRCVEGGWSPCRRGVLRERLRQIITGGVIHTAPGGLEVELAGEGTYHPHYRLSDSNDVVFGWHRHLHVVEEHTGGDVLGDLPVADAVIQVEEGLGHAVSRTVNKSFLSA